jgi:hypothetical protein
VKIITDNALTAAVAQTVADIEAPPHWQIRQLTTDTERRGTRAWTTSSRGCP